MDFNKMVNDALKQMNESGQLKEIVEKRVQETVKDVVKDAFESWSTFGKSLKEQVKEQIDINLENLDIPSYNQIVLNTVKDELDAVLIVQGTQSIKDSLGEILGTGKAEYKLSQIIEEIVKESEKTDELDYDDIHTISVHIDRKYKYSTYIYIDPSDDDVEWYRCKYKIVLNENGQIKSVEVDDKDFTNKEIVKGIYGVAKDLFMMWTKGTKIIIDDYQTEFSNPEYD